LLRPIATDIWTSLIRCFDARHLIVDGVRFRSRAIESKTHYLRVVFGRGKGPIHYEWLARKREKQLFVALHVEYGTEPESAAAFRPLLNAEAAIRRELAAVTNRRCHFGSWGVSPSAVCWSRWRELRLEIPAPNPYSPELAEEADRLMLALIQASFPRLSSEVRDRARTEQGRVG
jgi:hypothetical protein